MTRSCRFPPSSPKVPTADHTGLDGAAEMPCRPPCFRVWCVLVLTYDMSSVFDCGLLSLVIGFLVLVFDRWSLVLNFHRGLWSWSLVLLQLGL
jgi:hypothetical protein